MIVSCPTVSGNGIYPLFGAGSTLNCCAITPETLKIVIYVYVELCLESRLLKLLMIGVNRGLYVEGQQNTCNIKVEERILNFISVKAELGIEIRGKKSIEKMMNKIKYNENAMSKLTTLYSTLNKDSF